MDRIKKILYISKKRNENLEMKLEEKSKDVIILENIVKCREEKITEL